MRARGDLTTEAERLSYDWVKKHYGHEFLFITDYSAEKRAFYHMRDENGVPQGLRPHLARRGRSPPAHSVSIATTC